MKIAIAVILLGLLVMILRAGELYTQLGRYQRYWDRINQRPVDGADLTYVALGDSAAQGVGATRPDKGYVGLIAKELSKDTKLTSMNLSKSGARISDVIDTQLPRYESMQITGKRIITVDIGANDVVRTDLNDFEKDMDALMRKLPKDAVIADIPSFKGSRYYRLEHKVEQANRIMDKLAKKHGFELAEVHRRVLQNNGLRTFSADLFHPSDHGYRINWLPAFMERIDSLRSRM